MRDQLVVWHMGYRGVDPDELFDWMKKHPKATVVDIRYGYINKANPWSQTHLRDRLASRYKHFRSLGNVNYRDDSLKVRLEDLDKGVQALMRLLEKGRQPVLFCVCETLHECHRGIVLDALEIELKFRTEQVFGEQTAPGLFD
jgi:uncharacterized protein (DUF488 family)